MKNLKLLSFLFIFSQIVGCKKEELAKDVTRTPHSEELQFLKNTEIFNIGKIDGLFRESTNENTRSDEEAWGIGAIESSGNGRVFKSDNQGVSWMEPNSSARLKYVEIAPDKSVWGVNSNRNIWKWNGSAWSPVNGWLNQVSPVSASVAFGVSLTNNGKLYVTDNSGVSWYQFTTIEGVEWISVGSSSNDIWIIRKNNVNQRVVNKWNPNTQVWDYYSTYGTNNKSISSMQSVGAWRVNDFNQIFRSDNGINFIEPNNGATLYFISGLNTQKAWGLGNSGKIFRTINGGNNWSEPNSAARLTHISVN